MNADNKPIVIKNSPVNDKTAAERVIGLRQTSSFRWKIFQKLSNEYTEKIGTCRFRLITARSFLIGKISFIVLYIYVKCSCNRGIKATS